MSGVEEAGLCIDTRFRLELRHRQGPVDQEERSNRERDQPRIPAPEGGHSYAERGEHELGRDFLERRPQRVRATEAKHRRHHGSVDDDEHERGGGAGEREARVAARDQAVGGAHKIGGAPGGERRQRVVEDVEALDVPG